MEFQSFTLDNSWTSIGQDNDTVIFYALWKEHTHTWNNGEVTTPATCAAEGVKTFTCTVCGATRTETVAKDSSNHTGGTEVRNAVSATCGKDGYSGDTYCKGCGVKLKSGSTIPATGKHTWNNGEVTTPATCAAEGVKTFTCTVCGATKTETVAKDSSNHTGGTEIWNAVSATCGKDGYSGDTYCKGCGVKLNSGETIPATGKHTWNNGTVTTPATCAAEGVKTFTCTVCGGTRTETVAKDSSNHTGGTEVRNAVSATCGKDGYTGDTYCKGCGVKLQSGSTLPATGKHTWNNGTVTTPATCTAEGVKTFTCTVCNATRTEPVAKDSSNHTGGTEVRNAVSATCGKDGYSGDTYCKGCGVKLNSGETIPATGKHDFEEWRVTKAPSATEEGAMERVCSVCGQKETAVIPRISDDRFQRGDVNQDGSVTTADARLALRKAIGLEDYEPGSVPFRAADVDESGAVTTGDARTILRAAIGLERL